MEPHGKRGGLLGIRRSGQPKPRSPARGSPGRSVDLLDDEEAAKELFLLTAKPQMFCLNTDEAGMAKAGTLIADFVTRLRAKWYRSPGI